MPLLNRINMLIQQGIDDQSFHPSSRQVLQPGLCHFHVRGGGGEVQRSGPVAGQFFEKLPATRERDAPDVLPGNGQHVKGRERGGQFMDQCRQSCPGADHAALQRLEVQPVPVPYDRFTVQDHAGRYLAATDLVRNCQRRDA